MFSVPICGRTTKVGISERDELKIKVILCCFEVDQQNAVHLHFEFDSLEESVW